MENKCCCLAAFANGSAEKAFENETFSIYGHLIEDTSILIRYHSQVLEESLPILKIKFNDNENQEQTMAKCEHGNEKDYCCILELKQNFLLNICVANTENSSLEVKINKDPLKEIMRRYNLDLNPLLLPVKKEKDFSFKHILEKILEPFKKIFST